MYIFPVPLRWAATLLLWLPLGCALISFFLLSLGILPHLSLVLIIAISPMIFGGVSFLLFAIGATGFIFRTSPRAIAVFSVLAPLIHAALQLSLHLIAVVSGSPFLMDLVLPGVGDTLARARTDIALFAVAAVAVGYFYVGLAWALLWVGAACGMNEWFDGPVWKARNRTGPLAAHFRQAISFRP